MRLQKYLARSGVASRRASEALIAEGRVTVDGSVVTMPGTRVDPARNRIEVDGRRVEPEPVRWIALHKPPGYLCSRGDPRGRPTIYDLLPEEAGSLFHVGRLDYMSEGLVLLTNDGDAANRLMHPSGEMLRRYEVTLVDPAPHRIAERLRNGVELEDGPARAVRADVDAGDPRQLRVAIAEGRNREVRRMLAAVGLRIARLKRVAVGPIELGELPRGAWRAMEKREVASFTGEA